MCGDPQFTQILDFYLSPRGAPHLPSIRALARSNATPAADDALVHYCMEAIRLNGTFGSYRRAAARTTIPPNTPSNPPIPIHPGDTVFVSFVGAATDPVVFPDPHAVRLDRPLESYMHYGEGPHACLGMEASRVALAAMLRVVGGLEGLRRAEGPKGVLKKIPREGGFYVYMREDHGSYFPFPLSEFLFFPSLPFPSPWAW